ncbi:MAG: hypothetical protein Q7S40_14500 [Opitutaceae bacterium]|nr:hypothetical protein [Opitutaceae bacterium]
MLLVAILLVTVIAIGLVGYLSLSRTSAKLAHRTFFANDAANLAEAGLEEAIYCFNLMGSGTVAATAWTGWTISGTSAMRTLAPFNRDQNGVGIIKVYVEGYNGTNSTPFIISQAAITPFDGSAPIVKTLQVALKKGGGRNDGVVGLNGLTMKNVTAIDSFNSNPSQSATGPWRPYSTTIATANAPVVVADGTVNLGTGKIFGTLSLGPGVASPAASQVTGGILTNVSYAYSLPTYPTPTSVSQGYNVGGTLPVTLPVAGHLPASDGRYYYFTTDDIAAVTITAGRNVTIVGTSSKLTSGLALEAGATCEIYIDGPVTLTKGRDITNSDWAGALQIYTTATGNCNIGDKSQFVGCLYAPYAALHANGNDPTNMIVGMFVAQTITISGNFDIHYDEALRAISSTGNAWVVTSWFDRQSAADRSAVAGLTNNFLP